jgi:hypothetical protein
MAAHHLTIVVPYRDRQKHLNKFIPHMEKFLVDANISYNICIVEQTDDKPFNRAKLLNVGYDLNKGQSDYFCFHDIDMLPASPECNYDFVEDVCKLSYHVSQFKFIPRPEDELGGVILFNSDKFQFVNGYSNNYWGWGMEDNDLALRCKIKEVPTSIRKGQYLSLFHTPNGDTYGGTLSEHTLKNKEYYHNVTQNLETFFDDGLSTLQYKIVETQKETTYNHIKVLL